MKTVLAIAKKILRLEELKVHEPGFYSSLCDLIETISSEQGGDEIEAISNPSEKRGGYPDIQIFRKSDGLSLGFIEVKLPGDDLSPNGCYKEQFDKYKESIPNLIITDIINWQLWQWDEADVSLKKLEVKWDFRNKPNEYSDLGKILLRFKEKEPISAESPNALAKLLACRDKRLAEAVKEVYEGEGCPENLSALFNTIKSYLVKDIDVDEYVNMFAETITYSLFIARLQHFKNGEKVEFNLDNALSFLRHRLPKIPLLSELYDKATEDLLDKIKDAIDIIVQDLRLCKIKKIYEIFTKHTPDKDPIIYFYEPFLDYIDPVKKKLRGVFLTPRPIADFITRSVNHILKNDFELEAGLADNSVHLLDPAIGTGTFMVSAIKQIYEDLKKKWVGQPSYIDEKMHKIIQEHILERFYGFDVMMAPYAIAHLKLSILLEELGYSFDKGEKNKQFKIFLTNTLENAPHQPSTIFSQISNESEAAYKVKNKEPVIVITGNPPYSNFGKMNVNKWIIDLLDDYKEGLGEKKSNLTDDYIKFIRFAQWKLDKIGQGVIAMITNNSFIDGITHRKMRRSLLNTFDQVYILNLHGNAYKGEMCPDGSADNNVFPIKLGVSINIFVKQKISAKEKSVYYSELWGSSESKLQKLEEMDFESVEWQSVNYNEFDNEFVKTSWGSELGRLYLFVPPQGANLIKEYGEFLGVKNIFSEYVSGIQAGRKITIQKDAASIKKIVADFKAKKVADLKKEYQLKDSSGWTTKWAKDDICNNKGKIKEILYRPFDTRFTYFTGKSSGFLKRPRTEVMKHLLEDNLGLVFTRQQPVPGFSHIFCTKDIADIHAVSDQNYIAPLYLCEAAGGQVSNINTETIKKLANSLNLKFVHDPHGDLDATFGSGDVFYYVYGVLHSLNYRKKYEDLLQKDFPRIPVLSNRSIFKRLVGFGQYLVNLHLLAENPFSSKKIMVFKNPGSWKIIIKGDLKNLKVNKIHYDEAQKRVSINVDTYFEGIEGNEWNFYIGSYGVLENWLNERNGTELSHEDIEHFMNMVGALRETIKTMEELDPYVANIIQENMYVNFHKACEEKASLSEKEVLWKEKSKEERRDIAQGFAVYQQGNPAIPPEDVEFIRRLMLLTKDPLPWLQNKQPA